MGCKRMSTLHHHCTGAWCPACPPPGLHRSKVTLSSHTCFFVMACSTISNSFRGRQRALVQVSGWERPFLCCVGEGKGLYYFITERLGEVKWHLGLASICLHAGGSSRQSSGLGCRVKEEWKKRECHSQESSLQIIMPNNPAGLPKGISNVDSWCTAAALLPQ